jgi:integrase
MSAMQPLPLAEVLKLLDKLPVKYAALAALGVCTGCRISELLTLRRNNFLTPKGVLKDVIRFPVLKKRRVTPVFRTLKITPDFLPYILRHLEAEQAKGYIVPNGYIFRGHSGRHLGRKSAYDVFFRYLGRGYGTHWMRKTYANEMYNAYCKGLQDNLQAGKMVQEDLAHAQLDTTLKYLQINSNRRDSIRSEIFNKKNIRKRRKNASSKNNKNVPKDL